MAWNVNWQHRSCYAILTTIGELARAGMAKLADAADLKSAGPKGLWGFDSPSRHHPTPELRWCDRNFARTRTQMHEHTRTFA